MFGCLVLPNIVFSKEGETVNSSEIMEPFRDLILAATVGGDHIEFYRDGSVKINSRTRDEAVERLNCFILCFRPLRFANRFLPRFMEQELCTVRKNEFWQESPESGTQVQRTTGEGEVTVLD